ncbi:MAG: hypothetical protein E6G25_01085 [Actinobacteria bacterium]|nr:MAG: hypothetical protein E6G25_01085 [Actinomycetota bacterium]
MTMPRALLVVLVALAAVALPAAASSAPVSTSFKIIGYEYAFTSTVGSFAGNGSGNAGGTAYWNATVKHDRLGSDPTYVNGGSFAMAVRGPGSSVDAVVGTFTHHGGKITTLDRGANCTNQKYLVADTLKAVSTPKSSDGSGNFMVTLTHYRHRLLGRCVAYKARVSGTVSFTY